MMEAEEEWEMGETGGRPLLLEAPADAPAPMPPVEEPLPPISMDPLPQQPPHRCRLYFVSFLAALGAMLAAYLDGWTAPALTRGITINRVSDAKSGRSCFDDLPSLVIAYGQRQALYASLLPLGAAIGSALAAFVAERWGRRLALLWTPMPSFVGWVGLMLLLLIAGEHVRADDTVLSMLVFCGTRILAGLSMGGTCAVHTVYIVESTNVYVRGGAGALLGVAIGIGWVVAPLLRALASPMTLAAVPVAGVCLFVVAIRTLPDNFAEGVRVVDIGAEAQVAPQAAAADGGNAPQAPQQPAPPAAPDAPPANERDAQRRGRARGIVFAAAMLLAAPLLATDALHLVVSLAVDLDADESDRTGAFSWVFAALAYLLGALLSSQLLDAAGRRPVLLGALGSAAVAHAGIAVFYIFAMEPHVPKSMPCKAALELRGPVLTNWEPLVLAPALLALGAASGAWPSAAELLPPDRRVRAVGALGVLRWAAALIVLHIFSFLCTVAGPWQAYALLALAAILSVVAAARLLPETRHRSLDEIQEELMADMPPEEAAP